MNIREIQKLMWDFIDNEMDRDIMSEFEDMMEMDREFCCMCNTLEKTIELCHELSNFDVEVPRELHSRIIYLIKSEAEPRHVIDVKPIKALPIKKVSKSKSAKRTKR